ncbi:MAG: hypothetical protein ACRDVP_01230 [Acidimicrobiales bacterium]
MAVQRAGHHNGSIASPRHTGGQLLEALRQPRSFRPRIDPGLAGGLREWLEDEVWRAAAMAQDTIVITHASIRRDSQHPGAQNPDPFRSAVSAVISALVRQLAITGGFGDPLADGLAALAVDPWATETVGFIDSLSDTSLARFNRELTAHASTLCARWPRPAPAWLPRTQDKIAIPLAGGKVVLAGTVDLLIGAPSHGEASVAMVKVDTDQPSPCGSGVHGYFALLETLRSGAPPFRVGTLFTCDGTFEISDINEALITATLSRVVGLIQHYGDDKHAS